MKIISIAMAVLMAATAYGATIQTTFTEDEALSAVYTPSNGTYNYTVESTNYWQKGYWTNWTVYVIDIVEGSSPAITNWVASTTNQYVDGCQVTQDVWRIDTHYTAAEALSRVLTSYVYDGGTTYALRTTIPISDLTNALYMGGVLTNITGIYFADGSSIVTGGSLHVVGDIVTKGSIISATNVDERLTFLAWQEDPLGSQVTNIVGYTYTTNGIQVTGGAHNSDSLTSIFVLEAINYSGTGYASYTNTVNAKLFRTHYIAAGTSYFIQQGGDMGNPGAGFKKYDSTITGSYSALGGLYTGTPVLTWDITTNAVITVTTNSTYTVVTNTLYSTSNSFYYVLGGETNVFGDIIGATNAIDLLKVNRSGDTMTGPLVMDTNVTDKIYLLAPKAREVDDTQTVWVSGDIQIGAYTLAGKYIIAGVNDGWPYYTNVIGETSDMYLSYHSSSNMFFFSSWGGVLVENSLAWFCGWSESNTVNGTYTIEDGLTGTSLTVHYGTNTVYDVVTHIIEFTSNQFYYVMDGTTNVFGDSSSATNLAYIAAVAYTDGATGGCLQVSSEVPVAGAAGVLYSPDASGTNVYISSTIPGLTFTTDVTAAGASFTAMPTSADTPDGSDPTALMNVDYLSVALTNGYITSLTNQLHIMGVF